MAELREVVAALEARPSVEVLTDKFPTDDPAGRLKILGMLDGAAQRLRERVSEDTCPGCQSPLGSGFRTVTVSWRPTVREARCASCATRYEGGARG